MCLHYVNQHGKKVNGINDLQRYTRIVRGEPAVLELCTGQAQLRWHSSQVAEPALAVASRPPEGAGRAGAKGP